MEVIKNCWLIITVRLKWCVICYILFFSTRGEQEIIDSTTSAIEAITTNLSSKQEKLILLLQCISRVCPTTRHSHQTGCSISTRPRFTHRQRHASYVEENMRPWTWPMKHGRKHYFLFLAGFMRTAGTVKLPFRTLYY